MNSVNSSGTTGWTVQPVLGRCLSGPRSKGALGGLLLALVWLAVLPACNGSSKSWWTGRAVPVRPVRVKLLEDIRLLELAVSGPYEITDDRGQVLQRSSSAEPFRISQANRQILINGRSLDQTSLYVKPTAFGLVQVGPNKYRGYMRLLINRHGSLMLINHVPLEDYVASVLGGELPEYFYPEAFRAQAVAARTYVLHRMLNTDRVDWDVAATAASQVYSGLAKESRTTRKAQRSTRGQVLVYGPEGRKEVICAFYSSTCGGGTQPVSAVKSGFEDIPPLAGVRTDLCWDSPRYRWKTHVWKKTNLQAALAERNRQVRQLGPVALLQVSEQTDQGRPTKIIISDQQGRTATLRAEELRQGLKLPSTWFRIEDHGPEVWFTNGRGWGHGMGMCQFGADKMARLGYNYKQILANYYPQAELVSCY